MGKAPPICLGFMRSPSGSYSGGGRSYWRDPYLTLGRLLVWAYNCLNFFDTAFTADNAYSAHFQEFLKRSDRETLEGGVEDLERALDELTHGHGASAGTQEGSDDQSIIRTADPNSPPERKPAAKKEFDWGEFRRFPPRLRCYFVDVDVFYRRDPPRSRRTFRRCTNRILGELEECAREYLRLFESTHFSDSDLGRTWPRWRELVRPDAYPHEIVALDLLRHCERVRKRLLFMEETCAWDWPLKQLEDFAEILEGELKGTDGRDQRLRGRVAESAGPNKIQNPERATGVSTGKTRGKPSCGSLGSIQRASEEICPPP